MRLQLISTEICPASPHHATETDHYRDSSIALDSQKLPLASVAGLRGMSSGTARVLDGGTPGEYLSKQSVWHKDIKQQVFAEDKVTTMKRIREKAQNMKRVWSDA